MERKVMEKVKDLDGYWQSLKHLSVATGVSEDELQGFVEQLCGCCWTEAENMAAGEGLLAQAREEVDRLKQKLHQCNLTAMKQIAAAKGCHKSTDLGDDTITFHEPLQYLDTETRELVLSVVNEKVRLLGDGHAPQSLVEALVRQASAPTKGGGAPVGEIAEELERALLDLKEARRDLSETRIRAEDAEARADKLEAQQEILRRETETLKHKLEKAEALAEGLRKELVEAREALVKAEARAAAAEAAAAQARKELEELQQQHASLQAEHEALQRVSAEQKQEIECLREELEAERTANSELRGQVQELQGDLEDLQRRFDVLEEEANKMREELARRNNTRTHGTQTSLTGDKIEEQAADNKRLKLLLEELQMKMQELIEKIKKKGMAKEISQIAEDLGLQDILKEKTVFQRLYDDAMHRVGRLERLREKIRKERRDLYPKEREVAEAPVAESIGQSELAGLKGLLKDDVSQGGMDQPEVLPAHGGPSGAHQQQMRRTMKSSASLPALPGVASNKHASVITLGYGAHGKRAKHGLI